MKALKIASRINGKIENEADIKKHRVSMERAARLVTPRNDVKCEAFTVGDILCERLIPNEQIRKDVAILYAHGGGYMTGGIRYARLLGTKMALATGLCVYTFAYRLAPEHPYPAAIEDGQAVWEYLGQMGISPENLFVAGDSAGGNLALCLCQRLEKERKKLPRGLLLFSPWTDMTAESGSYIENASKDPVLTKKYVETAKAAYIPPGMDPVNEALSPLYGEMAGLPPCYIMAGRNGILLDDSIRLKERIDSCGGRAVLDIEENGWHVYQQMPVHIAAMAMKRLGDYVASEI